MKSYLILILAFIFALLQGSFLPVNLILLLVLVWAAIKPLKVSLPVAFFSGIFLNLAQGTSLGSASLFFLLVSLLVYLYSRRFDPSHLAFWPIFVFLAAAGFDLIFGQPWWQGGLILALISFLVRPILKFYENSFDNDRLRIKIGL